MDMFKDNEKSEFRIEPVQVKYPEDCEIDASRIDFSSDENIDFAFVSLRQMGIVV